MTDSKSPTAKARVLRRNQTNAEKALWAQLADRRTAGAKFRRQHPLGPYVVDLFCFEHKLVIEVDGGQHNEPEVETLDKDRTAWLEENGYKVLRFWNSEVMGNLEGVVARISEALEAPLRPSPQSSPGGRGGKTTPTPG